MSPCVAVSMFFLSTCQLNPLISAVPFQAGREGGRSLRLLIFRPTQLLEAQMTAWPQVWKSEVRLNVRASCGLFLRRILIYNLECPNMQGRASGFQRQISNIYIYIYYISINATMKNTIVESGELPKLRASFGSRRVPRAMLTQLNKWISGGSSGRFVLH